MKLKNKLLVATVSIGIGLSTINSIFPNKIYTIDRINPIEFYKTQYCNYHNGITDVVIEDFDNGGTVKVDCMTDYFSSRIIYADQWREGLGDVIYYDMLIDTNPQLVLVIENTERDMKYYDDMIKIAPSLGVYTSILTIDMIEE